MIERGSSNAAVETALEAGAVTDDPTAAAVLSGVSGRTVLCRV